MSQVASCPACDKAISIPDGAEGRRVKCGDCQTISKIWVGVEGDYVLAEHDPASAVERAPRRVPLKTRVVPVALDTETLARGSARSSHRERRGGREKLRLPGVVLGASALMGLQLLLNGIALAVLFVGAAAVSQVDRALGAAFGVIAVVMLVCLIGLSILLVGVLKGSSTARVFTVVLEILNALLVLLILLGAGGREEAAAPGGAETDATMQLNPAFLGLWLILSATIILLLVTPAANAFFQGRAPATRGRRDRAELAARPAAGRGRRRSRR